MTEAFLAAMAATYPEVVPAADFVGWSDWALARVGFRPSNTLAVVGVCRDELMLGFTDAVTAVWGPAFEMGSLAGLVFLGRTGLAAALGHVPGEDGRQRFAVFCFPHIGIDEDGTVGRVVRRGMGRATGACGALLAFRRQLTDGRLDVALEPDDLEQSLLRMRLLSELRYGEVPDLVALTEACRRAALSDFEALVASRVGAGADGAEPLDVAYLSGVVVHGPDGEDWVALSESRVDIDGVAYRLDH